MSRKQNWYIGRYVRAVSGFLPCSGKVKSRFWTRCVPRRRNT